MNLAPSLAVPPQLLEMAFQTALLVETERSRGLLGALSDQHVVIQDLEGLAQVETLRRFAESSPSHFEAIARSLSFLQRRDAGSYRDAAWGLPNRRRTVAGHEMIGIPGGWYVRGRDLGRPEDGWVKVPPYFIGRDLVTRSQFSDLAGRRPDVEPLRAPTWEVLDGEPIVNVTLENAERFARALREESGEKFRLPTREEWEIAARGPAVCLNRLMEEEEGRFRPNDLPEFARNRFQNFFFELGGTVFSDPRDKSLKALLRNGRDLYAYRVYATPSGGEPALRQMPQPVPAPSGKTQKVLRVWPALSNRMVEMEVPLTVSPLGFMTHGEENVWGVRSLAQGLWQILSGGWAVGGSYLSQNTNYFWASAVISSMGGAGNETGFRLALSVR